jgi:hypothetical protein
MQTLLHTHARMVVQLSEDNQRLMREKARLEHEKQALARLLEREREKEKALSDASFNGAPLSVCPSVCCVCECVHVHM